MGWLRRALSNLKWQFSLLISVRIRIGRNPQLVKCDAVQLIILEIKSGNTSVVPGSQAKDGAFWPTPEMIIAGGEQQKLYYFHRTSEKWSVLADGPVSAWMISPDSKYVYFVRDTPGHPQAMRVRLADLRVEAVGALKGLHRVSDPATEDASWIGVAPDGSLLLTRDTGTQEIYALNVEPH